MQSEISDSVTPATVGMLADEGIRFLRTLICSLADSAPAGLNMGRGVFFNGVDGDLNGQARSAIGASAVTDFHFLGVAVRDASRAHVYPGTEPTSTDYDYLPGEPFACIRLGRVHVYSEEAVDPSLPVYVRVVASGLENAGDFRASADSTDCILLEGAHWVESTSEAGVTILELDFPGNENDAGTIDLTAHLTDSSDAHDASAISFAPTGTIAATDVQAAIAELGTEKMQLPGSLAAGDIFYWNGTAVVRLPIGTAGQTLKVNAGATAPEWV